MKAIGYQTAGPISAAGALVDFETALPKIRDRDVLVHIKGVSVNPVDVKVRSFVEPEKGNKILGYDAAGIVTEVGDGVKNFKVGDEVFYAGDFTRPGTNAEYHAVDERIVGRKPKSIGFAAAAGFPLTSITAWEIIFDCFGIKKGKESGESLLILGAAGGVGSLLIQLAKQLTGLKVIATASRQETMDWVKKMGADHVINHRESLVDQMNEINLQPKYVASLNGTEQHFPAIVALIKPRGHIAIIDDPKHLDIAAIKFKALSFSWEFMFARSMFQTQDMNVQHQLLNSISELVDNGTLISTANHHLGTMSAATLMEAHRIQESGKVIGKNVLDGIG
ncbi:MAG: zinc-binding alcohol dehydrogenase family protein [Bacteroidota bacterium]